MAQAFLQKLPDWPLEGRYLRIDVSDRNQFLEAEIGPFSRSS
jgi:hypothetical protein